MNFIKKNYCDFALAKVSTCKNMWNYTYQKCVQLNVKFSWFQHLSKTLGSKPLKSRLPKDVPKTRGWMREKNQYDSVKCHLWIFFDIFFKHKKYNKGGTITWKKYNRFKTSFKYFCCTLDCFNCCSCFLHLNSFLTQ